MIINQHSFSNQPECPRVKLVAAYCRVSTLQEIQHHSLEAQKDYYQKLIASKSGWIFVGIYADQTSRRNNQKMRGFQNMMTDCRAGKINLILVKSISRMGRNTLQFLQSCDEMNQLGVEVYFEVENLYISNPKAMKMLTIYASLYQNESESKSAAVRWGNRTRFQNGTTGFASRICYGYRKSESGELIPYPPEAEVIKQIFCWHQQGASLRDVVRHLKELGIRSPRGRDEWRIETIRKILNNEKYYGNVLLQKTYVSDYFKGKSVPNRNKLPQYLIENNHEAIIKR